MNLNFMDFEIPVLKALIKLGGQAKPSEVYPEVEKIMGLSPAEFPDEYEKYKSCMIKWKKNCMGTGVSEKEKATGRFRAGCMENHRNRKGTGRELR